MTIRELEIEGIKVKGLVMKVVNDKNAKLQLSKNDIAKFVCSNIVSFISDVPSATDSILIAIDCESVGKPG